MRFQASLVTLCSLSFLFVFRLGALYNNPEQVPPDIEGNQTCTHSIGKEVWMDENLNVWHGNNFFANDIRDEGLHSRAWPVPEKTERDTLAYPESVVFSSKLNCYFLSNQGSGSISRMEEDGSLRTESSGHEIVIGLTLYQDTLWAVCNNMIKGFCIDPFREVCEINVPDAAKLNDIVADSCGSLYISDVIGNRIFKVEPKSGNIQILCDSGILGPNGLLFDSKRNRILLVSWRQNCSIQLIDPESGAIQDLKALGLNYCDGIAKDMNGYYYISEWENGTVHKFDSQFIDQGIVYQMPDLGPADIYFNIVKTELLIPLVLAHKIDRIYL